MLQINQILQNRYRVDRILGQGGMGAVYVAHDLNLEITCVVKEMLPPPDPALVKNAAAQFQREGKILAGLRHQSLPRVSNYFTEGDNYYLVMDLIDGKSLEKLIGESGLPEKTVLTYADQLLDVLAYIHSKGILHRDIKPANIIVQPDGRAVLVDFGLVKMISGGQNTRTLISALTPQYAPPEQYTGSSDQRSDLYSLAATLYQTLSGQAPASATDQLSGMKLQPLREWPHLHDGVSPNTERVLMKALSLNRDARYQNALEMKADLDDPTGGHQPIPPQELSSMATRVWTPSDESTAPSNQTNTSPPGAAPASAPIPPQSVGSMDRSAPVAQPTPPTAQPTAPAGQPTGGQVWTAAPGLATDNTAAGGAVAGIPPVKKPMSTGAKVALIGSIVVGIAVIACCIFVAIPAVLNATKGLTQTATPPSVAAVTSTTANKATEEAQPTETPEATVDQQATEEVQISETVAAKVQATTDAMATEQAAAVTETPQSGDELHLALEPGVEIELVKVPAGEFTMGASNSDKQADANEKPQGKINLDDYYIGKYDITNAQFAAFVKATGYNTTADDAGSGTILITATHTWETIKGANWQHPRGPGSNILGLDDYPVVMVSWDDAVAFCKWVSDQSGRNVMLPSEAQWEKAARGTKALLYPWGNNPPTTDLANFNNNEGSLMPVGDYSPAGDSPYGAAEMSGNVWQWTNSVYKPYPYDASDGREDETSRESRVVRGGSYPNPPQYLRVTDRLWYLPADRYEAVGFRVAVLP